MPQCFCSFAVAHTDLSAQPFNNARRTLRVYAPCNIAGTGVYLHFSNRYSEKPVWIGRMTLSLAGADGQPVANSMRGVTVYGQPQFALVPGQQALSDCIDLCPAPGQTLVVSLYYPGADKVSAGNFVSTFASRSTKGDWCTTAELPRPRVLSQLSRSVLPYDITSATTTLDAILIKTPKRAPRPSVVATFGDSIMQQGAWVTPFTQRLYAAYPGRISVCNLGIGGNRLLFDSPAALKGLYGEAGIKRFCSDIAPIRGLSHVIFDLGTNDLGLPGKDGVPESELISLHDYQRAASMIATTLHERNIKVYAGLLLPRQVNGVYTPEREQLRLSINHWLQHCALFDGVLDLAAPVSRADGSLNPDLFLPDGLHPNKEGGRVIADAIDESIFAPKEGNVR